MAKLKKLSEVQLNKIIENTQAELTRRKKLDAATNEIRTILKKYNIDFQDIDLKQFARINNRSKTKRPSNTTAPRDNRITVKAKYKNPDSDETWTGRGRTPKWIQGICQSEKIDLETFKKDERFKC